MVINNHLEFKNITIVIIKEKEESNQVKVILDSFNIILWYNIQGHHAKKIKKKNPMPEISIKVYGWCGIGLDQMLLMESRGSIPWV